MSRTQRTKKAASEAPAERASRARQRLRLIDASISALHRFGPSRTTIDKVVAIAGLSPGIVSFYFDSKAAMLVAALEHLASEFEIEVMLPVAALAERPVEALYRLVELMVDPDIASPRKVSVWYAFWGEATSREEYSAICGRRDAEFAALVQGLVERLVAATDQAHLDAEGITLGLVGALEIVWQSFAFEEETRIDRKAARRRCIAFLGSVFPQAFGVAAMPVAVSAPDAEPALFERELAGLFRTPWSIAAHDGDFRTLTIGDERMLLVNAEAAVSATTTTTIAAGWKLIVEHWLADAATPEIDDDTRTIVWQENGVKRQFIFPHLLVETRGVARRVLQLEPTSSDKSRVIIRQFGLADETSGAAETDPPISSSQSEAVASFQRWYRRAIPPA